MSRHSNSQLRSLLTQSHWTHDKFARAVNAVAAEAGVVLSYDRSAAARWLAGSQPRGDVPAFIAEALSRKLNRPVEPTDIGFDGSRPTIGVPDASDPVDDLRAVVCADLESTRQSRAAVQIYRRDEAAAPPWPGTDQRTAPRRRSTTDQSNRGVDAITSVARSFASLDRMFGGGHARTSLVTYLAADVVSRLGASGTTHPDLYAAAAACAGRVGFMCFDGDRHAMALTYFRLALRLATAGDDAETYAAVLRAMSLQAWSLGHHRQAVDLATASADSADSAGSERVKALALGQFAVARAAAGDLKISQSALQRARYLLETGDGALATPPRALADLAFHTSHVLEYARDLRGATAALETSLRERPAADRRSRAITHARLATLLLRTGRVGLAGDTVDELLADHVHLYSARVDTALTHLRPHLERHRHHPAARRVLGEVQDRVELITARSRPAM